MCTACSTWPLRILTRRWERSTREFTSSRVCSLNPLPKLMRRKFDEKLLSFSEYCPLADMGQTLYRFCICHRDLGGYCHVCDANRIPVGGAAKSSGLC